MAFVGSGVIPNDDGQSRTAPNRYDYDDLNPEDHLVADPDEEVRSLARKMTRDSIYSLSGKNPFEPDNHPELDPSSPKFNSTKWAKAMLHVRESNSDHYIPRTAGFAFRDLNVFGYGQATDYQKSVGNIWLSVPNMIRGLFGAGKRRIDIIEDFAGVVHPGEMLVVLGPPGSGCSTFLKTIAGELNGIYIDPKSLLNYQGVTAKQMHNNFRGEAIYTAEVDVHFPQLTVGDTLKFAALARAPRHIPGGVTRDQYAEHMRDVIMAVFGISHTKQTQVGNDFVRGVSGGERKRVTIAEAGLSGAPLQCWDNSTRGLDSANAIEFCKNLRTSGTVNNITSAVAIYQAPQAAYDVFDKVLVLYEGQQIYFGKTTDAKQYFIDLGFACPDRQTVPDFLTSMTSPQERIVRDGFQSSAPFTPVEFAARWKDSLEYKKLIKEIEEFDRSYPFNAGPLENFKASRRADQARSQRVNSPFTLSYFQQIRLCIWRSYLRVKADPSLLYMQLFGNAVNALVIASVFYNLRKDTASFFQRGALLFFAILINAFSSALEILTLYAQRPIVEKQSRYAFYHPSAEAWASTLADLPVKFLAACGFNLVMYFMTNLRREPGAFFFFFLITFTLVLCMSMFFRTIASVSRTLAQALAPAAVIILAIVIYTGFAIPISYMRGWSRWINYIDLVGYAFESLMVNEFHGRQFSCSSYTPNGEGYENVTGTSRICNAVSAVAGQDYIDGDVYIASAYNYYHAHKWRNFGILLAFFAFFTTTYMIAAEFVSAKKSKGEVLVFPRSRYAQYVSKKSSKSDPEARQVGHGAVLEKGNRSDDEAQISRQTAVFHWEDLCYDIKIEKETRRILDHVDGWVKPGTLTALMGVSGAGKTTLLDVLATRTTMGVIYGNAYVDGKPRDVSFQRKTGYVQQQDLHLETSTVREALEFSAIIRQPAHVSRAEKIAYVDEVIKMLDMQSYADAIVGVPGEGLNVEQRKRLTIGVELAAKPQLLLFLDEPTSGLDSQTSWAICDLMEKLTKNGQAILCTIHQPSAILFQRFDRLLFLAKGGRTVYFGDIGRNSHVLLDYFVRNGAEPCPADANPAEYMLRITGATPDSETDKDWHQIWRSSPEYASTKSELKALLSSRRPSMSSSIHPSKQTFSEFSAPFHVQLYEVTKRVFQQYWRTPSYIYSKVALCLFSALFIGFSFYKADNTIQGLQNQMFAVFMVFTLFGQVLQQILPHFVTQRALYEARERPSKAYSWKAFMLAQIFVEIPWNFLMSVLIFFSWYYPIGLHRNAIDAGQTVERGGLMFLLIWMFLLFTSTFADMMIAGIDTAETAGTIGNVFFSFCLIFCGVLASPQNMPRFWIFMYRVSPFTYLASAMLSVGVANTKVTCAANEILHLSTVAGQTCGEFLGPYAERTKGQIMNPGSTDICELCPISETNQFLTQISANYADRWRNFGLLWVYVIFNICAAVFLYWLARVPKKSNTVTIATPPPTPVAEPSLSSSHEADEDNAKKSDLAVAQPVTTTTEKHA